MDNLSLYRKYCEVPKEALKAFDNGKFKGTDINTMWRIKSLTEEFGVCGIGWYPEIVRTWTENGANGEVLCFAEIKLFIKVNGEWSKGISATGGSTLVQYVKSGQYHKSNDEGFKMAITDALGVACKLLGFGANTYWEHGRSKYTEYDTEEQHKQPQKTPQKRTEEVPTVKPFKKLTKAEIMQVYGVRQVEQTIEWFEGKFGVSFADWGEDETEMARAKLAEKKAKRETERQAQMAMIEDADIPFPMGGGYAQRED